MSSTEPSTAPVTLFDVRATDTVGRDLVRSLSAVHELFTRRTSTAWGGRLGAVVKASEVATDQATYDDFVSSMPTPNVLAVVALSPLPAPVVIELNPELALTLVARLLGAGPAAGGRIASRRLTDIETMVLGHLLQDTIAALVEALRPLGVTGGELLHVEHNPQLAQVVAPAERVVLLTYDVVLTQGVAGSGLLTLCYPHAATTPLFEALEAQQGPAASDDDRHHEDPDVRRRLHDVALDVRISLRPGPVATRELAGLCVGDVLALDHRAGEPASATVGPVVLFEAHLGQRGRRRAVQVATPPSALLGSAPPEPTAAPTPVPALPEETTDVA